MKTERLPAEYVGCVVSEATLNAECNIPTVTDTTLKWYRTDYLAGNETPLAARRYDYAGGEYMQAYVCLRNKKWVAQLEHHLPGYGYRATTLYGESARQVLAAMHANQSAIIWEIWERSEAVG